MNLFDAQKVQCDASPYDVGDGIGCAHLVEVNGFHRDAVYLGLSRPQGLFGTKEIWEVPGSGHIGGLDARQREDERILFWHRGLAILDIAVGLAILRRAEERDAGTMLRYR